jgi:hypothetical protein
MLDNAVSRRRVPGSPHSAFGLIGRKQGFGLRREGQGWGVAPELSIDGNGGRLVQMRR